MARKSWDEKFDDPREPEIKPAPKDFADIKAGQIMLLTTPRQLDAYLRAVPRGVSLSMKALRGGLAGAHGAETACPIVTGIQLRVLAERAAARLEAGERPDAVTPVWRAIEPRAPIIKKLERGAEAFMALRRAEGLDAA